MLRLLPRMALEAPNEYVAFVERHLPRLRRDAALVVGEGRTADELYPDVLTDVAARWRWLELLHRWLGRREAADAYLRRAFARRAKRWQDEQITPVEVEVWRVEELPGPAPALSAWDTAAPVAPPSLASRTRPMTPATPMWSSMALRLAPVLLRQARLEVRPLAEAAVAWWHAYEAQRRRKYIAAGTAIFLLLFLLTRLQLNDSGVLYAPRPSAVAVATQALVQAGPA